MQFGYPIAAVAFLLIPLFLWFAKSAHERSLQERHMLFDEHLAKRFLPSALRPRNRLFFGGLFLLVCALLRPQFGFEEVVQRREGIDILFVVDVSKSMLATDVTPSRLERVKFLLYDLLGEFKGDRVGLITFAGVSFLEAPLTYDYGTFRLFVDDLSPELSPVPGTNLESALSTALDAFRGEDGSLSTGRERVILLFSDGEELSGAHGGVLEKLTEAGVRVFPIGIGSPVGAPIPENGAYKKDAAGKVVMTKLDEETLREIGEKTGGAYLGGSLTGENLKRFFHSTIMHARKRSDIEGGVSRVWGEYFQIPLLLSLVFFFVAELLMVRRS